MRDVRFVLPVFAKLNITLRVTGRRPDGYHDLLSTFLRIPSGESLLVEPSPPGSKDAVELCGMDLQVRGEDSVSKALRLARELGADVPPLRVEVRKALYPGAGLGAGSGDAAALLQWLASERIETPWMEVARRTGADVPFLFSGLPAALISGTGERIEPLPSLCLRGLVAFPDWETGTADAYASLDAAYGGRYPMDEGAAREEADRVCCALDLGERVGLLPNDFLPPLMEARPQYEELFDLFDEMGALAWGLTGSGSAAFALLQARGEAMAWPAWVRQVLYLPPLP